MVKFEWQFLCEFLNATNFCYPPEGGKDVKLYINLYNFFYSALMIYKIKIQIA